MLSIGATRCSISRCVTLTWLAPGYIRRLQTFAEGDYVWLHHWAGMKPHWRQIPPAGEFIRTRKGALPAAQVLGRSPGDLVRTTTDEELRLGQPTLEEHILYHERVLTPIYPRDANLVVSRLDLHPEGPSTEASTEASTDGAEPLEILEAGTGMGALSLHLARALFPANPRPSAAIRRAAAAAADDPSALDAADASALAAYKASRRSILHTVERSPRFAAHARRVIGSFRGGVYAPTIDSYVGDVSAWLADQTAARGGVSAPPFLHHVLLDLPDAEQHVAAAARALRPDGLLVVFAPSISQVELAVLQVRSARLPLVLDDVLEMGTNMSGGRSWVVQLARLRNSLQATAATSDEEAADTEAKLGGGAVGIDGQDGAVGIDGQDERVADPSAADGSQLDGPAAAWKLVARPRVVSLAGGGFLALFRKRWPEASDGPGLTREEWGRGVRRPTPPPRGLRRSRPS